MERPTQGNLDHWPPIVVRHAVDDPTEGFATMMDPQSSSERTVVKLLPYEGWQLVEVLKGTTGGIGSGLDAKVIDAVLKKLGDANALALWLREYVSLELQPKEATEVVRALEAAAARQDGRPENAQLLLAAVRDRLSTACAECRSGETYVSAQ
jgi:hypothetical protein